MASHVIAKLCRCLVCHPIEMGETTRSLSSDGKFGSCAIGSEDLTFREQESCDNKEKSPGLLPREDDERGSIAP